MLSFITPQDLAIGLVVFFPIAVLLLVGVLVYVARKLPGGAIKQDIAAAEAVVVADVVKVETAISARLTFFQKIPDRLRMLVWLVLGLAAYAASFLVGPSQPVVQTTLYKIGHVTTLAWVGYWISRKTIGRITPTSTPHDRIARALMIGAVIVAGSLGL